MVAAAATAGEGQFRNPAGEGRGRGEGGYGYYGWLCHALSLSLSLSLSVVQRAPRTSVISFGMWRLGKEGKLEEGRSGGPAVVRPEIRLPDAIFVSISSIQIDTAARHAQTSSGQGPGAGVLRAGSHLDLGARHSDVSLAPMKICFYCTLSRKATLPSQQPSKMN